MSNGWWEAQKLKKELDDGALAGEPVGMRRTYKSLGIQPWRNEGRRRIDTDCRKGLKTRRKRTSTWAVLGVKKRTTQDKKPVGQ